MKDWLTKQEIIKITGMPARTLQRIISDGKCRYCDDDNATPGGKQTVVLIDPFSLPAPYKEKVIGHEVAHVRSAPGSDLSEFTDNQVKAAITKRLKLQDIREDLVMFERHNKLQTTGYLKRLCKIKDISIHSYYRWNKAEKQDGLAGLVPGWGGKSGCLKNLNSDQKKMLMALYLDGSQIKMIECARIVADVSFEKGLAVPSVHTVRRFLNGLPEAVKARYRKGEKHYNDKYDYYTERDYTKLASNGIWCGDHHQVNVCVRDFDGTIGFPWFTTWIDVASRMVVGWHLQVKAGNSRTIAASLRNAILKHGIPEKLHIDNGKDYRSKMIAGGLERRKKGKKKTDTVNDFDFETKGMLAELKIGVIYAWPYHPRSKIVERFYRTLDMQFSSKFEGYRGNSIPNRPDKVDVHMKAAKAGGPVMHIRELNQLMTNYIDDRYNIAPHKGQGMEARSPSLAWRDKLNGSHFHPANPAVLDLLMMPVERKKVRQRGVNLFKAYYYHADLFLYKGTEVDVRYDPHNLSTIDVYDKDGRKICQAVSQERLSWNPSKEDIEKLQSTRKKEKNLMKDIYDMAVDKAELPDLRKRITAGSKQHSGPVHLDRRFRPKTAVTTRLDDFTKDDFTKDDRMTTEDRMMEEETVIETGNWDTFPEEEEE